MCQPPTGHSEVLAQSPCAQVSRCAHGHLHVSVGPVTVRMEEGVLRALALTLRDAVARLEQSEPREHLQ